MGTPVNGSRHSGGSWTLFQISTLYRSPKPPTGFQVVRSVHTQRFPTVNVSLPGICASRRVQMDLGPAEISCVTPCRLLSVGRLFTMVASQTRTDSWREISVISLYI